MHILHDATCFNTASDYIHDLPLRSTPLPAAQVNWKVRSFTAPHLLPLIEGLARLGYRPRTEIMAGILSAVRRHLHVFTPQQLPGLLHALASYDGWAPHRQFLYDYVTASEHKVSRTRWLRVHCVFVVLIGNVCRSLLLRRLTSYKELGVTIVYHLSLKCRWGQCLAPGRRRCCGLLRASSTCRRRRTS